MVWQGIEGQDAVVERFIAAHAQGRVGGAYLFLGMPGIGKGSCARALAKALVCSAPTAGLIPCGACASCVQAAAGSHPDIDVVEKPEDRSTLPLEAFIGDANHRMREGLCWRLLLRPALGGRKVAIILDADHLGEEAANCLLKTLEEPPDSAVIILVGTALERQLPTIRSRCQIVRFAPLGSDAVERIVRHAIEAGHWDLPPPSADLLRDSAERSGGSVSRARLLLDPALEEFRGRLLGWLCRRPLPGVELAVDTLALVDAAGKEAPPRRARLKIVLEAALDFFRAALRRDAGAATPPDALVARAVGAWGGTAEEAAVGLRHSLQAIESVDRNAHLPTLVDAWTTQLEQIVQPAPPVPRS